MCAHTLEQSASTVLCPAVADNFLALHRAHLIVVVPRELLESLDTAGGEGREEGGGRGVNTKR